MLLGAVATTSENSNYITVIFGILTFLIPFLAWIVVSVIRHGSHIEILQDDVDEIRESKMEESIAELKIKVGFLEKVFNDMSEKTDRIFEGQGRILATQGEIMGALKSKKDKE